MKSKFPLKLDLQFFATRTVDPFDRLTQIQERRMELAQLVEETDDVNELRSINTELTKLNIEENKLKFQIEKRNQPKGHVNVLGTYGSADVQFQQVNQSNNSIQNLEERAALLGNGRAVQFDLNEADIRAITISGGEVTLASHNSNRLNPGFFEVSSLIDLAKSIPLPGGETYKSGFIVSTGDADYSTEGADYSDNENVKTDFVDIVKSKITTYFEVPEEVQKLGGEYYLMFARDAARTALRKKIARQMILGTGATNTLTGIFHAPDKVIPSNTDMEISEIAHSTLDEIVFSYGGDEAVEGGAYLILNKQTLAEFARIKTADGNPFYKIKLDPNGNIGTISSRDTFEVPFVINSAVKSFQTAQENEYFLAYGKPQCYELALFSGIEVMESKDFKFKSGQIALKGSVFVGGNVASYKGFLRIKKAAAV